jgi:hypothetical protein
MGKGAIKELDRAARTSQRRAHGGARTSARSRALVQCGESTRQAILPILPAA